MGSDISLYAEVSDPGSDTVGRETALTVVYHSMRRGNKGNGIVKAKRSRTREIKTIRSTEAMVNEIGCRKEQVVTCKYKLRLRRHDTKHGLTSCPECPANICDVLPVHTALRQSP